MNGGGEICGCCAGTKELTGAWEYGKAADIYSSEFLESGIFGVLFDFVFVFNEFCVVTPGGRIHGGRRGNQRCMAIGVVVQ